MAGYWAPTTQSSDACRSRAEEFDEITSSDDEGSSFDCSLVAVLLPGVLEGMSLWAFMGFNKEWPWPMKDRQLTRQ